MYCHLSRLKGSVRDSQRETRFVLERVLLIAHCYDETYLQAVSVGQLKHRLCGDFILSVTENAGHRYLFQFW